MTRFAPVGSLDIPRDLVAWDLGINEGPPEITSLSAPRPSWCLLSSPRAIHAKASEVPPDEVPPLRLLPALGGWRGWLTPLAAAAAIAIVAAGSVALSHVISGRKAPGGQQHTAAATWNEAAAWVAAQVSRSARVSCDPVMCSALRAHGFPAGDLEELRPGAADPRGSDVIVATAAIRRELSGRLSSVYAPVVVASFGSGSAQIDVCVIAPHGAGAYKTALRADLAARKAAGAVLARSLRISAMARKQLMAGEVDSRLLVAMASVAASTASLSWRSATPAQAPPSASRSALLSWPGPGRRTAQAASPACGR